MFWLAVIMHICFQFGQKNDWKLLFFPLWLRVSFKCKCHVKLCVLCCVQAFQYNIIFIKECNHKRNVSVEQGQIFTGSVKSQSVLGTGMLQVCLTEHSIIVKPRSGLRLLVLRTKLLYFQGALSWNRRQYGHNFLEGQSCVSSPQCSVTIN